MPSPEELARRNIERLDSLKDWSSGDKTLSEGKVRRVSAGSANQFQQFVTPDDGRKFTELYNVQHLQSSQLDRVSRVCISTIQRLYSMLRSLLVRVKHRCPAKRRYYRLSLMLRRKICRASHRCCGKREWFFALNWTEVSSRFKSAA